MHKYAFPFPDQRAAFWLRRTAKSHPSVFPYPIPGCLEHVVILELPTKSSRSSIKAEKPVALIKSASCLWWLFACAQLWNMRINYIHLWSFMLYTNNAWKLYNFNRCHLRSIKYVLKNGPHLEASHQHPVWPSLPQEVWLTDTCSSNLGRVEIIGTNIWNNLEHPAESIILSSSISRLSACSVAATPWSKIKVMNYCMQVN